VKTGRSFFGSVIFRSYIEVKILKTMRYKDLLLQKVETLDIMINNLNLIAREGQITDGHFEQLKDQIEEIRYQISLENED
jgi:hypothetical protein